MDIEINPSISFLDEFKCQAAVLVPVLKALRAQLGEERANSLILGALREWSRERIHRQGSQIPGSPLEKWEALMASSGPRIGNDADMLLVRDEPNIREWHITDCRYADFFLQIGEPELGAVLGCEGDYHATEVGWPEVTFTRTQTIMKGAPYCDCLWRIKSELVPE